MNRLQTNEKDFEVMNVTVKFNELPKELQQYIRVVIYNKTNCYIYDGKCNWDKLQNSVIGLQVYKDYYKCISVYYIANDGYYSSVGMGKIYNNTDIELVDYTNSIYPIKTITEQLSKILTDFTIQHDYDREQLMEAIELGDVDMVDDIVGDRDIFELI